MLTDLRHASRLLGKSPGFALTVILTLGLGIGACTLMFSIIKPVLLEPRHANSHRTVFVAETLQPIRPESAVSVPNFLDWRRLAMSFEVLRVVGGRMVNLTGTGEPLPLTAGLNTEGSSLLFGETLLLGRALQESDYRPDSDPVVVLHEDFWRAHFGAAREVLGRRLILDDRPHTVVGVTRLQPGRPLRSQVTLPLIFSAKEREARSVRGLNVFGLLKPGVTIAAAQTEMDAIAAHLAELHPDTNQGWGVKLTPMRDLSRRDVATPLWTLGAAVTCVLLIACANVANLLLARAVTRHRELSIRAAVGASRHRLVRHLLVESVLLALLGGGLGVLLAQWGLEGFRALAPVTVLRGFAFTIDGRMLAFALGLSLATGLLCGLVPAWLASRVNLIDALKSSARGGGETGRRGYLRATMVAAQIACAVVLLSAAGLLLRSFVRLTQEELGFEPENCVGMALLLPAGRYPDAAHRNQFVDTVLERLRALPGVEAAGATLQFPISGTRPLVSFAIAGRTEGPPASWPGVAFYTATPDYFRAAGMRLLRGRDFAATDTASAPRVAIINETLARQHFAGEDPIGRQLKITRGGDGWREIVGVVSDIKQDGVAKESACQVYEPNAQSDVQGTNFVVRFRGQPAVIMPLMKQQLYAVDPKQPIRSLEPLQQVVDGSIAMPRFLSQLLGAFAALALVIAVVGIYAVMAYTVGQRTVEIGIRMALGATAVRVRHEVLRRGAGMIAAGLALGLAGTAAAAQLIRGLLFHTSPHDPVALGAVALVLTATALAACWLPAQRATQVDPLVALRAE